MVLRICSIRWKENEHSNGCYREPSVKETLLSKKKNPRQLIYIRH